MTTTSPVLPTRGTAPRVRMPSDEVRYLVVTATEDQAPGQTLTVVVGGPTTAKTLETYHSIRRGLGR